MNTHPFTFHGAALLALGSGALYWPDERLLVVSDLHFGKAARLAAVGGAQLPPYDMRETLARLEADLNATGAREVLCLGDSFDAPEVERALPEDDLMWLARLQAGRRWIWVLGNHDPGPLALGGDYLEEHARAGLVFRHIAAKVAAGEVIAGEVSGHYHPKARLALRGRQVVRPCFLLDAARLILPAYGAFTGGLFCDRAPVRDLMAPGAQAILTGARPLAIPMPGR